LIKTHKNTCINSAKKTQNLTQKTHKTSKKHQKIRTTSAKTFARKDTKKSNITHKNIKDTA
jgi:hypothetical protein